MVTQKSWAKIVHDPFARLAKSWPTNHSEDQISSGFVFTSLFPQDLPLLQVKQPQSSQEGKKRLLMAVMAVGKSVSKK